MSDFANDIEQSLSTLHSGGVILYPTDTIWGLGCDATNETAVEKIINLKERPAHKSFVVLVASERDVLQYVSAVDLAVFDYLDKQTKPITVIYQGAIGLADNVLAADGSVAIRICKDEFCRTLIKRFRKPIVSTSANISNQPSPSMFLEINPILKKGVDYLVKYRQEETNPASASSIIKWGDGEVKILR